MGLNLLYEDDIAQNYTKSTPFFYRVNKLYKGGYLSCRKTPSDGQNLLKNELYNTFINKKLLKFVKNQFILDENGIHGIPHWERVERIGLYLAKGTKADKKVISLFALLHDSQRKNEDKDSNHGLKSASFVHQLYETGIIRITKQQLQELVYACKHHSDRHAKSDNITIQICWDSDRLDLFRLHIQPDPSYLLSDVAKKPESLEFAQSLFI